MALRGDSLREHILYVAKDAFLEMGFERASMDAVAARAGTSKRTLYAHFESKERLYLAVIELVRGLHGRHVRRPGDYPGEPAEAVAAFCVQFLGTLLYTPTVRMCRLSIAEAGRFPEGSARYFDVLFSETHARLAAYLRETLGASVPASDAASGELLGRVVALDFPRALFGLRETFPELDAATAEAGRDAERINRAVVNTLTVLRKE